MNILFFGSTTDSVIVLEKLFSLPPSHGTIVCVVTQPPRPIGRKKIVTPTPVQRWAEEHTIPVVSFPSSTSKSWEYENEETVINTLQPFQADLIVSASYGQKIPSKTIADAKLGGLNVHPSLLPRWRGADPVPWAMIAGDHQTGVTVVTLSEEFDKGTLIAQKKVPISPKDTADPLRTSLFSTGAQLLFDTITSLKGDTFEHTVTNQEVSTYARKFTRDDGYIPWSLLQSAMDREARILNTESWEQIRNTYKTTKLLKDYFTHQPEADTKEHLGSILERIFRALTPWPGMWTEIETSDKGQGAGTCIKRVKILSCHTSGPGFLVLDSVQVEGKNPTSFEQFQSAYLYTT